VTEQSLLCKCTYGVTTTGVLKTRHNHNQVLLYINGEANNFKMELFNDIHDGSGGC